MFVSLGIAAAYNSMSSHNSQSTSNFSITSIHRSNKKSYKVSESVSNFQKADVVDVASYSDDEDIGNSRIIQSDRRSFFSSELLGSRGNR